MQYLKIISDFVESFEKKFGPVLNWTPIGSVLSSTQPRDLDLVIIVKEKPDPDSLKMFERGWHKLQQTPPFDLTLMTGEELKSSHEVTTPEWFIQYLLYKQAKWQKGDLKVALSEPLKGYFWAMAERWYRRIDKPAMKVEWLALGAFLGSQNAFEIFPTKLNLLEKYQEKEVMAQEVTASLKKALENDLGEALSSAERLRWQLILAELEKIPIAK